MLPKEYDKSKEDDSELALKRGLDHFITCIGAHAIDAERLEIQYPRKDSRSISPYIEMECNLPLVPARCKYIGNEVSRTYRLHAGNYRLTCRSYQTPFDIWTHTQSLDGDGCIWLMKAASRGSPATFKILSKNKAIISARDTINSTTTSARVLSNDYIGVANVLLEAGASADVVDGGRQPALNRAAAEERFHISYWLPRFSVRKQVSARWITFIGLRIRKPVTGITTRWRSYCSTEEMP